MTCENCILCILPHVAKTFYYGSFEAQSLVCVRCFTCKIPMWVLIGEHRADFSRAEKVFIEDESKKLFGNCTIRWSMPSIPDHAHCHVNIEK